MAETKTIIEIPDFITVRELADFMEASPIDVIKTLMNNGIMANINQQIDFDTAAIVAEEMGFEAVPLAVEEEEGEEGVVQPVWKQILADEEEQDLVPRPPVVTMLGHVDHGKTSLLDIIRQANVQAGEAGGITQHIGAYQVNHNGELITFLDTPGHEAFTAMRARGAQATDIAILVIAADDGIMPQTLEAIDHARAARVSIVVALNKMDLDSANPNRVLQQLAEIGLTPDEWDGDTLVIPVSAKLEEGIDDLLEAILLSAEELHPRANPDAPPTGTALEARLEKGRGVMVTLLVQNGTLKVGDTLLVDGYYGRIKAMYDFNGRPITSAGPATPVSVAGLNGIPEAGEQFIVVESEKVARHLIDDWAEDMNLVIKADVQGSLEPLVNSLERLSSEEVAIEIMRAATGNITENDIMLAAASDAVVLGFNVDVDPAAKAAASNEQVEINIYSIIYKLIEDVEKAMKGMLAPVYKEVIIGRAEVRQIFKIRSVGVVAGSYMRTGEARRNARVRVIRNTELLHSGEVASLKHLQENVREVKTGFEFGVSIDGFNDYEPGDILEFFVIERAN
ncbi:MAG: translation initiation factor IF-2 [Anaerolineae bacterium SG8_19]|nr:MAG: translation initiation factor IF-2 [Anaerolineae bacterium SG8_19]